MGKSKNLKLTSFEGEIVRSRPYRGPEGNKHHNEARILLQVKNIAYTFRMAKGTWMRQEYTGITVPLDQWSGEVDKWIKGNDPLTIQRNKFLGQALKDLELAYWTTRGKLGKEPTADEIFDCYQGTVQTKERVTLGVLIPQYLDAIEAAKDTRALYKSVTSAFDNYLRIKAGGTTVDQLNVDTIDTAFIYKFELFLAKSKTRFGKPYNKSSIIVYVERLKALLTYAKKMGIIEKDPGENYIKTAVSKPEQNAGVFVALEDADFWKISQDAIAKIECTPIQGKAIKGDTEGGENQNDYDLQRVRLIFLLQTYTGFAYGDLVKMNNVRNYIRNDLTGKRTILYNRDKNGELAIVPLFDTAIQLLEALEYNAIPLGSYDTYKRKIKALLRYYDLDPTEGGSHLGRHIFGSRMLTMGFPMESVSRMMGHKSIRVTEKVYARIDITKIYADFDRIKAPVINPLAQIAI
ncbi:MAG: phage integrase SAM-like domain-containing protein [Chryseolinea sp.]